MANKFKVGDWVEFVDWAKRPLDNPHKIGRRARVVRLDSDMAWEDCPERVEIVWDDSPTSYPTTIRECRLRLVNDAIVTPAPVTRGGYKVTDIYNTGDEERPFGAKVHLPSGPRSLTFSKSGNFYERSELPVDLVNA